MSRSTQELLDEALVHFELANQHAASQQTGQLVVDAISMRLSAGIEVLANLAPEVRDHLFGANWQLMWGMRNRIAHGYLLVSSERIHQTVAEDLPEILRAVRRELDR